MINKYICKKPGPRSIAVIERDKKVISQCLTREHDLVYKKAKDCWIWDEDGRRYLDFGANVAVMNAGHNNPEVVAAIESQLKYGTHCGFSDFFSKLPVEFAETVVKFLPRKLNTVFFSNSGTESVEAAIKLARWHTGKKWLISFEPSFHGRTMGSLSITQSLPVHRERFGPFLHAKQAPYPYVYRHASNDPVIVATECLNKLEKIIKSCKKNVAGVFMEPVAGESGYIVPPKEWVKGVRQLCNDYGLLLIADEVQSGMFRTGHFLALENFGVTPDVVCLSKSIGGGLPMGVTVANRKIMNWPAGAHANTMGGNLLACASGLATLKYMKRKNVGGNAMHIGKFMLKKLKKMQQDHEIIGDVRGLGLMIGVELVKNRKTKAFAVNERKKVLCTALEKGLVLLPSGKSTIRICPPLTITKKEAAKGLHIFEESLEALHG